MSFGEKQYALHVDAKRHGNLQYDPSYSCRSIEYFVRDGAHLVRLRLSGLRAEDPSSEANTFEISADLVTNVRWVDITDAVVTG